MGNLNHTQVNKHAVNQRVKSVRIRSYSGPYFPAFGLNTERNFLSLCIQSKCAKMRIGITLNRDTFYAVNRNIITYLISTYDPNDTSKRDLYLRKFTSKNFDDEQEYIKFSSEHLF